MKPQQSLPMLCIWLRRAPNQVTAGPATPRKRADAMFVPADKALEKLLASSARLSQQVLSFQEATA